MSLSKSYHHLHTITACVPQSVVAYVHVSNNRSHTNNNKVNFKTWFGPFNLHWACGQCCDHIVTITICLVKVISCRSYPSPQGKEECSTETKTSDFSSSEWPQGIHQKSCKISTELKRFLCMCNCINTHSEAMDSCQNCNQCQH